MKNLEKICEEFGGFPALLISAAPAEADMRSYENACHCGSARLQGGFPKPPAPLERRPAIMPEPQLFAIQKAFKNAIIKRRITSPNGVV